MPLALLFKIKVPKNKKTVNLESASFIIIMHLPKGLTHIKSQIKPWLHLSENFTSNGSLESYTLKVASLTLFFKTF